jgi:hypothetical protein
MVLYEYSMPAPLFALRYAILNPDRVLNQFTLILFTNITRVIAGKTAVLSTGRGVTLGAQ